MKVETTNPFALSTEIKDKEVIRSAFRNEEFPDGSSTKRVAFYSRQSSNSHEAIKRSGLLTIRPNAKGTILLCHGYMCSKFDISFLRTMFPDYNCMIFDFRAHGEDIDNQLCTFGKDEAYDVIAAAKFLKRHPKIKGTKLFGYGFSMGAVSLIEAQAKMKLFDAMILDCPFDSSETIFESGLSALRLNVLGYKMNLPFKSTIRSLTFNYYTQPLMKQIFKFVGMDATRINSRFETIDSGESIKKISVPCLFIHCRNDNRIPITSIKRLFESTKGIKKMWITNGRGHCDSFLFNPEKYKRVTNSFLIKFISGKLLNSESGEVIEDA